MGFYLYIMRHAKYDWSGPDTADFDRPINQRGRKNAKRIGRWMLENGHVPEKVISSPAMRARETSHLVTKQLKSASITLMYDKDLYLASFDTLIECVQLYKSDCNSLMLVAHNPGLEQLLNYLLRKSRVGASKSLAMTTANLAIFEYSDDSFNPEIDKNELLEFVKPKELD